MSKSNNIKLKFQDHMDANKGITVEATNGINSQFLDDGYCHASPAKAIAAEAPSPTGTAIPNPTNPQQSPRLEQKIRSKEEYFTICLSRN